MHGTVWPLSGGTKQKAIPLTEEGWVGWEAGGVLVHLRHPPLAMTGPWPGLNVPLAPGWAGHTPTAPLVAASNNTPSAWPPACRPVQPLCRRSGRRVTGHRPADQRRLPADIAVGRHQYGPAAQHHRPHRGQR